MGVNGKIQKCAISGKGLIVERNGSKFGTRVLRTTYVHVGYFSFRIVFEFSLGSFGAFYKISHVKIFKMPKKPKVFIQLPTNFSMIISWEYRLLPFC